jgi:hypothetical protein
MAGLRRLDRALVTALTKFVEGSVQGNLARNRDRVLSNRLTIKSVEEIERKESEALLAATQSPVAKPDFRLWRI